MHTCRMRACCLCMHASHNHPWQSDPLGLLRHVRWACRSLWASLLGSLAALPPAAAAEVVSAVHARIAGAGQTVAPRLRAEPFGDAALTQVRSCGNVRSELCCRGMQSGKVSAVPQIRDPPVAALAQVHLC